MTSVEFQDIGTITTLQLNDKILGERVAGTTRQLSFTKISDSASKPLLEFTAVASAVNNVILSNNSTTLNPSIGATGTDTNISIDFLSKGSGSVNLKSTSASAVKISSGTGYQHTTTFSVPTTAASRTITIPDSDFTMGGTTVPYGGTGATSFTAYAPVCGGTTSTGALQSVASAGTSGYPLVSGGASALPSYSANPTVSNLVDTSGNTFLSVSPAASAVNYIRIINSATGGYPIVQAYGSDTNVNLGLYSKGTGIVTAVSGHLTIPFQMFNGTSNQHYTYFNMANTAATRIVTFPDYDFRIIGATTAGSAGQILQSGAASANTWSTPTYPSASGTSRKILVSDGTNNVYSTETYAVPGTSGKVMQSDGTNWTSATPTGTGTPVLATSPTLITPTLGVATATSITFGGSALSTHAERQTFTPVLNFGGATTGITYTTQEGYYNQTGKVIQFQIRIVLSSKGSATGSATITGLPTVANGTEMAAFMTPENLTFTTQPSCFLLPGSSTILLYQAISAGVATSLNDTHYTNTTRMYITGTYQV